MTSVSPTMRYQKLPVVIEAFRLGHDKRPPAEWWGDRHPIEAGALPGMRGSGLIIPTLEGAQRVYPGDWIIRDVTGEVCPCRHDIFIETYEKAP